MVMQGVKTKEIYRKLKGKRNSGIFLQLFSKPENYFEIKSFLKSM